jgi:Lrp/AsnC family transcriptional regulator
MVNLQTSSRSRRRPGQDPISLEIEYFSLYAQTGVENKNIIPCRAALQRRSSKSQGIESMDAIDRKILAVLQADASLSVAEIGQRVGLSSTPCWKRIQRLEADGVIQKRVALIDQDKLGLGVTVFVSVETGDHSQEWLDSFARTVGAMPEVMEFYRMAGDVDYMLRVVVPDIQGYDGFYKRLIAAIPLKNVTSRFAMEKIKSTTALPIA